MIELMKRYYFNNWESAYNFALRMDQPGRKVFGPDQTGRFERHLGKFRVAVKSLR